MDIFSLIFSCRSVDVICGSDGVTYTNECERQKAQCEAQRVISVIRKEPCGGELLVVLSQ